MTDRLLNMCNESLNNMGSDYNFLIVILIISICINIYLLYEKKYGKINLSLEE